MASRTEEGRRPLSEWAKSVKIAMIQRDWDMGDLAKAVGKTREYTSAIVNERVRAVPTAKAISEILGIQNTAYSSW